MNNRTVYRNLMSMGTRLDMVFLDISEEQADTIFHEVRFALDRWEQRLSIYKTDSVFSQINNQGFDAFIELDSEMVKLFSELINLHKRSLGYFDFTLGKIVDKTYSKQELNDYLSSDLSERIDFRPEGDEIKLLHPMALIDSGGFGKGLALDTVKKIVRKHNIKNSFISFGGSSVLGLGKHTAVDFWPVGIADFKDESSNMYVFELYDSALSVSGNTSNNLKKFPNGHLINPKTGKRNVELELACVQGRSAFIGEILSTSAFVCPEDKLTHIKGNFPDFKFVKLVLNKETNKNIIKEY
jgi:thiamine biosynthesis lipoprotein